MTAVEDSSSSSKDFSTRPLRRMEGEGFINGYWRRSDAGGPDRKYYKLTPDAGKCGLRGVR